MNSLIRYLFFAIVLSSCQNIVGGHSQITDDIGQGEALYSMNLKIAQKNADQEISSSIFSQDLSIWKRNFIRKYGDQQWANFRSQMISNYGYDEKMNWFLK